MVQHVSRFCDTAHNSFLGSWGGGNSVKFYNYLIVTCLCLGHIASTASTARCGRWSVFLLVTVKTAELIEMLFEETGTFIHSFIRVGPSNHALDGGTYGSHLPIRLNDATMLAVGSILQLILHQLSMLVFPCVSTYVLLYQHRRQLLLRLLGSSPPTF